ncbi:MAG: TIGR03016 family PEP-CTERM system-associated outer membrane protein [Methylococcaceae bacterium]|nr:TIGR03016 family PEP-CTERM system-associated outer membrane protein [Methylococcaceae bacterium]
MHKLILLVGATYTLFAQTPVFAIDFRLTPSLTIQETYSDNIRLAVKGQEKGAFVTEISPGLSIRGINGGRLSTNLNYRLQTLFNAGGDGSTQIYNQLQFNTAYQVVRNRLNVAARSSINQQNISNLRGGDNINNLDARTNVWTAGTSLNWTPHFGQFANANVNIDFDYVGNDNADQLANSMNLNESISLTSGRDFKRITWNTNFDNTSNFRENEDDVGFQNSNATIRGWVDRRFNFFGTVGYANNSFQGLDTNTNGFFYTVGAQWKPSWYFDMEAGYGNNWHVSSNLNLSQRTHFSVGYNDRSKDLNTGGAWNASLHHNTARSAWNFTYLEDTTTVQQILLQNTPFSAVDADGNQILGSDGQPITFNVSLPSLNNDVLVRKVANASVSYATGKSSFQVGGFYERRAYQNSAADQQTVYGADASWNWQFWRRTSLFLSPTWQRITGDAVSPVDIAGVNQDRYQFITRLTRTIPLQFGRNRLLNASIEYRFVKQNADIAENTYMENRLTASLFMNF